MAASYITLKAPSVSCEKVRCVRPCVCAFDAAEKKKQPPSMRHCLPTPRHAAATDRDVTSEVKALGEAFKDAWRKAAEGGANETAEERRGWRERM